MFCLLSVYHLSLSARPEAFCKPIPSTVCSRCPMMEYSKGAQWYYRGMLQGGQFDLGGPQGRLPKVGTLVLRPAELRGAVKGEGVGQSTAGRREGPRQGSHCSETQSRLSELPQSCSFPTTESARMEAGKAHRRAPGVRHCTAQRRREAASSCFPFLSVVSTLKNRLGVAEDWGAVCFPGTL